MERLDGGAPDPDAGIGEPVVDAGEGHAGHADQGRLLDLRRVCRTRKDSAAMYLNLGVRSEREWRLCLRGEAVRARAGVETEWELTWVVEMLDEPVFENGQRFGAEVALLPPVETWSVSSVRFREVP